MLDKPIIVGCGTMGSSLALKLSQTKYISQLKLYDFDVVGETNSYPFKKEECGLPKIKIIEFLCRKYNSNLTIESYQEKVTRPFQLNSFVIDCRDCKDTDIGSRLKISLDGCLLYIDSIRYRKVNQNYHRYMQPRNETYINKAMNIIETYLEKSEYIFGELKLYNLEDNSSYILKREDEGCL